MDKFSAIFRVILILFLVNFQELHCFCGDENSFKCPENCSCSYAEEGFMLDCRNSLQRRVPSPLPPQLEVLQLQNNRITAINKNDLAHCDQLKKLYLSNNDISTIHQSALRDIRKLTVLDLKNNSLKLHNTNSSLPMGVFDDLMELEELYLTGNVWNSLSSYRCDVIQNKPYLTALTLDAPHGGIELCDEFRSLQELTNLEISGGLSFIDNDTLAALKSLPVKEFTVSSGHLHFIDIIGLSYLPVLNSLDLSGNNRLGLSQNLSNAWYGLRNSSVSSIGLKSIVQQFDYHPYTLEADFFDLLNKSNIKELYLDINGIVEINIDFHSKLPNLRNISLSYNRIFDSIRHVLVDLAFLRNVRHVDIGHQSQYPLDLERLGDRKNKKLYMYFPKNLVYLDLSAAFPAAYQEIKDVIMFTQSKYISRIDVSENRIKILNAKIIVVPNHRLHIDYLKFSDCGMITIIAKFIKNAITINSLDLSRNNVGAQIAKDVQGKMMMCLDHVQLKQLNLSNNNIKVISSEFFKSLRHIEKLDLSQNALTDWHCSVEHMVNLTLLDLSGNIITYLKQKQHDELDVLVSRNPLITLDLTDNPIECQCYSLDFLKWMTRTDVNFVNKDYYKCRKNGELVSIQNLTSIVREMEIECSSNTWIRVTGSVFSVLAVLIVLIAVLYRYRWDIRYGCLRLQRQRKQYQILEDARNFQFDAFVAYHQEDLHWVINELLPNLEGCNDPLKLCIHHRNWLPGPTIEENISESLENSRKTLLILSQDFIKSAWCEFEMQMAQMQAFNEGRDVIVIVALEDIPMKNMSRTLANLRRSNTWLDWFSFDNERNQFWRLLRRAIDST